MNQWLEWSPSGINTTVQCFIRSFDDEAAHTLHKCVDDAKSGGVTAMTNSRSLVPSDLRNLGPGATEKPHSWGRTAPCTRTGWEAAGRTAALLEMIQALQWVSTASSHPEQSKPVKLYLYRGNVTSRSR